VPPRVGSTFTNAPGFSGRPGSQYGPVDITVTIDTSSLDLLPERMDAHLKRNLELRLAEAARKVIEDAQLQLQPGHGYDTGLLHDSLTYELMRLTTDGVFYELGSDQAAYWQYVEFGHMTRSGNFWPGYHMLENALRMNEAYIRQKVREAWADTALMLAAEARTLPHVPGIYGGA
jgi:hypothetical protein